MANYNLNMLASQASIELGGNPENLGQLFRWDQQNQRHQRIRKELGDQMSRKLRLIYEKRLAPTDVKRQQNRFVIEKQSAEEEIFRCLTRDKRESVLNGEEVPVVGHDGGGREWRLRFKLRTQRTNGSKTYVLIGQWADMVKENNWEAGSRLRIWGFPYAGIRDQQELGPDHNFDELRFVFTL